MSHLLSLAALHAAAPGVLDVVFGPDGDFEGAPCTVLQVFDEARNEYMPRTWPDIEQMIDGGGIPLRYALDCRVPSIAARLAGLCARARGVRVGDGWSLVCEVHPGVLYRLVGVLTTGRSVTAGAWLSTGRRFHTDAKIGDDVKHPPHGSDPAAFLATLTLERAPQIAGLRTP